jgi:hypothetical protein
MIRITLASLALISILFAPVWVTALLGVVLAILWEAWEVIILGLLVDLLYLPLGGFFHIPMIATLLAIGFVWAMIPIRKRIFLDR